MKKTLAFLLPLTAMLFLSGCGNATATPVLKSPRYALGEQDGCATANGTYTKNRELFKNDPDYEKGWFAGRKQCNPSFHKE